MLTKSKTFESFIASVEFFIKPYVHLNPKVNNDVYICLVVVLGGGGGLGRP